MDKRPILMINPHTRAVENEAIGVDCERWGTVSFGGEQPRWWAKVKEQCDGTEGNPDFRFRHPGFIDHQGIVPKTDVVVGNPYRLTFRDFEILRFLRDHYRIQVDVKGISAWYPGHTLGVYLTPTRATYALLKLKPGAEASCMVAEAYQDILEDLE